ncbi:hypothetical protein [Magnetospirillum aberrantis]|uniref:Uncharacterized protein n=1 Tax=Magnetospirillum aberrantis SpK TaxID=908842 RepID=A0A7C9QS15_9PROT|nr:hypothetical protein [Magnetospirillum aberrantis]NFV79218.1 hypothetical protein [Magnetospirillum aberrantis SpK]
MGKDFRWMWFDTDHARIAIVIHPDGLEMSAEELARVSKAGLGRHKKPTTVFVMDNMRPIRGGQVFVHQIIGDGTGGLCLSDMARPWSASSLGNLLHT